MQNLIFKWLKEHNFDCPGCFAQSCRRGINHEFGCEGFYVDFRKRQLEQILAMINKTVEYLNKETELLDKEIAKIKEEL